MTPPWYDRFLGAPEAGQPEARREILVIDDQPEMRDMFGIALRRLGWTVRLASSGEEAIALMETAPPTIGLALVDVVLPGIDGVSVARRLRASYPRLGIILVSGQLKEESRWIVSEEGFKFLPKPFSLRDLGDAVIEVLGDPELPQATS